MLERLFEELLLREVLAFGLVLARITGFVLTSPFPGEHAPRTVRVGLVVALAFFCRSVLPGVQLPSLEGPELSLAVVTELSIGAVIGFVLRVLLSACDVAGEILSQTIGLGSASLMNPLFGPNETALSRSMTLAGLLIVLASGTHRLALAYLIDSFISLPFGSAFHVSMSAHAILDLVAESIALGARLALPVAAVSLVVQVSLAMVARVAPTLQIFNVGFAVLIGCGLLAFAAVSREILLLTAHHIGRFPELLERVLGAATE